MKSALLTLLSAMCLSACGSPPSPDATHPASSSPTPAGYFAVPAEQLPHLKLVTVARTSWVATVRTTGTVDWTTTQPRRRLHR